MEIPARCGDKLGMESRRILADWAEEMSARSQNATNGHRTPVDTNGESKKLVEATTATRTLNV